MMASEVMAWVGQQWARRLIVWAVMCAGAAAPASAQVVRDLSALTIPPRTEVIVRHAAGQEVRGRFVSASSVGLVLEVQGSTRTFDAGQVNALWRRGDPLRNGALIGGLLGLLGGIFGHSSCTDCGSEIALGIGLGVPLWAGVGALVDAQRVGRTLIYLAPGASEP